MPFADNEKRKISARIYHERKGRYNSKTICKRNMEYIRRYREDHPCVSCGESRWWILDFDHKEETEKVYNISRMRYNSLEKLKLEISKCEIRCKNCHADRHYQQSRMLKAHKG